MVRSTAGQRGAPAANVAGAAITTTTEGAVVNLRVSGTLDGVTAIALLDALRGALENSPERVDVDLAAVTGYTDAGIAALATCKTLTARVPDGLHYCTEGGAGQEALLAAFSSDSSIETV